MKVKKVVSQWSGWRCSWGGLWLGWGDDRLERQGNCSVGVGVICWSSVGLGRMGVAHGHRVGSGRRPKVVAGWGMRHDIEVCA